MAHFLIELQCMPSLFTEFVTERGRQWHEEPLQPAWRCVEQLIHLIMRTVQGSTVVGSTSSIPQGQNLDELVLTDKEVGAFKDEAEGLVLVEHVGLQSKVYAQKFVDPATGEVSYGKKAKGVPKSLVKHRFTFETYLSQLNDPRRRWIEFKGIRLKRCRLTHESTVRKSLTFFNDKVYEFAPNQCRALGHWRNDRDAARPDDGLDEDDV